MNALPYALILTQLTGSTAPSPSTRRSYALQLFADIVEKRVVAGQDISYLTVECRGKDQDILYIRDESKDAKQLYMALSGDQDTDANLLHLGFRVIVLVNEKHGTFVFNMLTRDMDIEDVENA